MRLALLSDIHASPGTDDGVGMRPTMSDAELAALLTGCEADLVCVGHTHWPQDRTLNGVRMVNLDQLAAINRARTWAAKELNTSMTMFNTTLTDEYVVVANAFHFGVETVEQLALNALRVSFLPAETRVNLEKQFLAEFDWLRAEHLRP